MVVTQCLKHYEGRLRFAIQQLCLITPPPIHRCSQSAPTHTLYYTRCCNVINWADTQLPIALSSVMISTPNIRCLRPDFFAMCNYKGVFPIPQIEACSHSRRGSHPKSVSIASLSEMCLMSLAPASLVDDMMTCGTQVTAPRWIAALGTRAILIHHRGGPVLRGTDTTSRCSLAC